MTKIEDRMARLERQNRWWRALATTLAVALGVPLILAARDAAAPEELRVRKLVLVDEAGGTRAELSVQPDGSPALRFPGTNDVAAVSLRGAPSGPILELADGQGGSAWMSATTTGTTLVLSKNGGEIEMAARASGFPKAEVRDKDGQVVWRASE